MNSCCPTDSFHAPASSQPKALRGPFAALQRLINTAGFVSTDLTDTVFAALPKPDGAPYEAVVRPNCSE